MRVTQPNRLAVGTLSLIVAGAIGGGVALGLSAQDAPQPVELRQVAATPTAAATTEPVPTTSTTTTSPTTTATATAQRVARPVQPVAPKVQATAQETTPEPVAPTPTPEPEPVQTTAQVPHQAPPVIPGNGPHIAGTETIPAH